MRKVQRWRYYCDFCKKAGNAGGHMLKHEASCSLNPDRVCRMCKALINQQPSMAQMLALLPAMPAYIYASADEGRDDSIRNAVSDALPALRELCGDCPVCVFAALRQKGIPVPLAVDFNLTKEIAAVWNERNSEREEREGYGMGLY